MGAPRARRMLRAAALSGLCLACACCGARPRPKDAYAKADDLLTDLTVARSKVRTLRITGRVDDFGGPRRVQGRINLFADLPQKKLRIELLSPFGTPLAVLTVDGAEFAYSDLREGKYRAGPAEPCNIGRLIHIPLPVDDVLRILVGHAPIIEGNTEVAWDGRGFYRVTIAGNGREEALEVGSSRQMLPLYRAVLDDPAGHVFSLAFDRWRPSAGIAMPREIRAKMPREKVDILLRYDEEGVELNVELPDDAWIQHPPVGAKVERVTCS